MKKLILALCLFAFSYSNAQITAIQENFETLPLSFTSSGSSNWSRSASLFATGAFSDSARIIATGDSAILTSASFSSVGYPNVYLKFDHICKVAFGDGGFIEFSTNNGATWAPIPAYYYQGVGQYLVYSYFNSVSYPADWMPLSHNEIPTNGWWKHEEFDISSLVTNQSQIKIRFRLQDLNINGGEGDYGWLLDNISVVKSVSELTPPSITLITPIITDTVTYTGPYDVHAYITDSSGILKAYTIYNHGNAIDTILMTRGIYNDFHATIPSFNYDSSFCYRIVAIDSSLSANKGSYPGIGCKTIQVMRPIKEKVIGLGAAQNNYGPVYIDNGAVNKYSNHISIFTAAELGFTGTIKKIAWFKATAIGFSGANTIMKVYVKHTALNAVPASFATELNGATLVYENQNQTFPATIGWLDFVLNQSPFVYNGSSNIMVLVEFYHPVAAASAVNWYYTNGASKSITFYGAAANPTTTIGASNRPNIRLNYDTIQFNYDAGIVKIVSPTSPNIATTATDIKVRTLNYGKIGITKLQLNWELDGVLQTPYVFNGIIPSNLTSNDITIGSKNISSGLHKLKAWTSLPNDSADQNHLNDTILLSFYSCNQVLSGNYTIGSQPSADFHSIGEVAAVLKNCGVQGPTVFNILPGTYLEQVSFDTIFGLDSINTVTFQSSTLNANDVIIQGASTASINYIIQFAKSKYITFNKVSIVNTSTLSTAVTISFINGSDNNTIRNCKISMIRPTSDTQMYGLYISGKNDKIVIENNEIKGGRSCIYVNGSSVNQADRIIIRGNKLTDSYRYIVSINGTSNIYIAKNYISGGHVNAQTYAYIGITITNSIGFLIEKNRIVLNINGPAYAFDINTCQGDGQAINRLVNNFMTVTGPTASPSVYCIHLNGSISYFDMYNNSLYSNATGGPVTNTVYYEGVNGNGNINFVNNAVMNFSGGAGLFVTTSSINSLVNSKFDYNSYYSNGGPCVKWGASSFTYYQGIGALTAVNLKDSNSVFANPNFYSETNLHSFGTALNNKATVYPFVTTDFDDEPRSLTTPDIGADEFSISTVDAGIISIIQPLAVDTQNKVLPVRALVQNYGSNPLTTITGSYKLNNAAPVLGTWTGNLASGAIDTINFGNITIPGLNYTITAYTTLVNDTLKYNDTATALFYGIPYINLSPITLIAPITGCDRTNSENITVRIKNKGAGLANNGMTVSYKVNNMATYITEAITNPIASGDSIDFTFSAPLNMVTGYSDSIFSFTFVTHQASDPFDIDDTLKKDITSLKKIPLPLTSDTTINYGNSASLFAQSSYTTKWFSSMNSTAPLSNNNIFNTPVLFDTTTYYVQAVAGVPAVTAIIGTGTGVNGQYGNITPYTGAAPGQNHQQYLYLASELVAAGLTAGNITSASFYVTESFYTPLANWELRISTTNATNLTTSFLSVPNSVYFGSVDVELGWNQHNFSTPFYWDGVSNIIIEACSPGGMLATSVTYTQTPFISVISASGPSACGASIGSTSYNRPNIKFKNSETVGCASPRTPVKVNVILPALEARMDAIINPISSCGISTTAVTARIINMGTSTIPAGFTAAYKINNSAYSTPAVVNSSILPTDTLNFTFPGLASLPSGTNGLNYQIKAYLSLANDAYLLNDTVTTDSIFSKYTPAPPVVSDTTVSYGQQTYLKAVATDSVFWYSDLSLNSLLGYGANFNAGGIYDTTIFYATAQRMKPLATYSLGVSKGTNTLTTGPSPYGSVSLGAKNQYLIRASELRAMGIQKGQIRSISFNPQNAKGVQLENYTISLGLTSEDSLTDFLPVNTVVFNALAFVDVSSWNTHNFIQPFNWDGQSNIIVQTCFKNSTGVGGLSLTYFDSTSFASSAFYQAGQSFDWNQTTPDFTYHVRPIMRLSAIAYGDCASNPSQIKVSVSSYPTVDAGIVKIEAPSTDLLTNSVSDVKVIIKNYGLNTLTNASIGWTENGIAHNAYAWSGSLPRGKSDTITIASNHIFDGGPTVLKAFIHVALDTFAINDSAMVNLKVCMHDTFRIGASRRFKTFNEAVNALNICGICGPVVFAVDSGTYGEQFIIGNIVGLSPLNTITFTSASQDSSHVKVFIAATNANENYVVKLMNTSNIRFTKMSFASIAAAYSVVFHMTGTTNNINIENSIISSAVTNDNSAISYNIYGEGAGINNIIIKNNTIKNGKYAVYFYGNYSTHQRKISILNNTITNFGSTGVYFYWVDTTDVRNNIVTSSYNETYYYGIRWLQCGVFNATGNKVNLYPNLYAYGIYPATVSGTAANPSTIYNNTVGLHTGNGSNLGIFVESTNYVNVVFNSVLISSGGNESKALGTVNGTGLKILNNNLVNLFGYTISSTNPAAIAVCNYNNYFTSTANTGYFALWSTSVKANFAALIAADPTKNINSINYDPTYYSTTDLHVYSPLLDSKGVAFPGVTTDIDGQIRNATTPDIGADEFTPIPNDFGVIALLNPKVGGCNIPNTDTIKARIFYFGVAPIDFSTNNVQVQVQVTGVNPTILTHTLTSGIMTSATFMDVVVSTNYNMSAIGKYTFAPKTVWALDSNYLNDGINPITITRNPIIDSFPFNDNFESGLNITFKEQVGTEASIAISNQAASSGIFGLHLYGGIYVNWGSHLNVNQAFSNTSHIAKAQTCDIDATNLSFLSMRFALKQTNTSTSGGSNSWFRVLLTPNGGIARYIRNSNGDSVFTPLTSVSDPFVSHIFNLNEYAGTVFSISLEAVNCYRSGVQGTGGDNVYIDDFSLFVPTTNDISAKAFENLNPSCGKAGNTELVKFSIENIGTDTLDSIPVAYRIDNGPIIRDTIYQMVAPNTSKSIQFITPFTVALGSQEVIVFTEFANDADRANDTLKLIYKGLNTFSIDYFDNFDVADNWYGTGLYDQWALGSPSKVQINAAYSTPNAWVTKLNYNYTSNSEEYLYSPFITIPLSADSLTLEFQQNMSVIATKAYGRIQYSFDMGATWLNYGYMNDSLSENWYNTSINGLHVWSSTTNGWVHSSIKLDPQIFNTGDDVWFRFVFKAEPNQVVAEGWAIDDFKLSIKIAANDAGVVGILQPTNSVTVGDSTMVKIRFKNLGSDTMYNVPVSYAVNDVVLANEIWYGTLVPSKDTTYTFNQKLFANPAINKLCAFTKKPGDAVHSNDTLCLNLTASPAAIDAGIVRIIAPIGYASTQHQNQVKVKIKNYGTTTLTSIPVSYKRNNIVIANETFIGNIVAGDSADYTFTATFGSLIGSFSICAKTNLTNDAYLTNDEACTMLVSSGIEEESQDGFYITQTIPNPASGKTRFNYFLPKADKVKINLINLLGETVYTKSVDGNAGINTVELDLSSLNSGVYYYTVDYNNLIRVKRLIIGN